MAWIGGRDRMKEETKDTIVCILIFAIPIILLVSFVAYMFLYPKIRGISYCDDNRYYMVNAITGGWQNFR